MRMLAVGLAVFLLANCAAASETGASTVARVYPHMSSGALRDAELAELRPDVLAICESVSVTRKDLDEYIARAPAYIRDQMRRYSVYALEQDITSQLILLEAKDWAGNTGRGPSSGDGLAQSYLDAHVPKVTVTDGEAEEFYKEHSKLFGDAAYDRIKDAVVGYLMDERKSRAEDRFRAGVSKRHKMKVSASWFVSEHKRWATNPVESARVSGKPTFVNFSVIGCCDKTFPVVEDIRRSHGDMVNVVFVHVGQEEALANLYGIGEIPSQFFFSKDGKEVFRHVGFLPKDQITEKLAEMGAK